MKCRLLIGLPTHDGMLRAGQVVDIPDHLIDQLHGKVEPLPRQRNDAPPEWSPSPKAWVQNGGLRTTGVFDDLASEIVKLTVNAPDFQRRTLIKHCQSYTSNHFRILAEKWEERAAILEYEAKMPRGRAEVEAARQYNLLAFLPDLQRLSLECRSKGRHKAHSEALRAAARDI